MQQLKLSREMVRQEAAKKCWLSDEATWSEIWKTAAIVGQDFLESLRAWVSDRLDGQIPAH
jgi:frataxin-like iron-binding protein CyaY